MSDITTATQVAAGGYHGLALLANGTVDAWGWNRSGQLGRSSTDYSSTPVEVSGLSQAVAIAAGHSTSYALESDGTLWAWGYNGVGQLGNGSATDSSTPVQVANLGAETLSISSGPSASHALAIVAARASVSPASLAFGHQTVGSNTAVQAVTLNAAPGPLSVRVSGVAFAGLDADSFTISYDGCSNRVIAPSASCTVGVRSSPEAVGSAAAMLVLSTNEPSGGYTVSLTGTGDPAPPASQGPAGPARRDPPAVPAPRGPRGPKAPPERKAPRVHRGQPEGRERAQSRPRASASCRGH